jgi:hypothetical protein
LTQKKRRVRKKRRVSGKSWDGVIGRSSAAWWRVSAKCGNGMIRRMRKKKRAPWRVGTTWYEDQADWGREYETHGRNYPLPLLNSSLIYSFIP